ncbi:MAG: deoxyguanosinetriphosphate triphosphohydrolase family protein [Oscillospiraceae bacterium]
MDKPRYNSLSKELTERIEYDRRNHIENPYRFKDENSVRRNPAHDIPNLWRPTFIRDAEKILYLPTYNRYTDKTQVFSFYKNDDISRRALHVQLVSRIARNIGAVLGLNLDLIEAVALGHDIGHTPFGHAGEHLLDELLYEKTGLHFNHNVHSARVLDRIFCRNLTLQTLDGVLCHNGEIEQSEYRPIKNLDFETFDKEMQDCYTDGMPAILRLVPSTLESCVVRISDIIAYIGKDRQDAVRARLIDENTDFSSQEIGTFTSAIINNLTVDIIENSYGKDYIALSEKAFDDLSVAKRENYEKIYKKETISRIASDILKPMFKDIFEKTLDDLGNERTDSPVFKHHIEYIAENTRYYSNENEYLKEDKAMIAADFIASMTDDYFTDLYSYMFPEKKSAVEYVSYFKE